MNTKTSLIVASLLGSLGIGSEAKTLKTPILSFGYKKKQVSKKGKKHKSQRERSIRRKKSRLKG